MIVESLRVRNEELVCSDGLSDVCERRTDCGVAVPTALNERTERRRILPLRRSVTPLRVEHHSQRTAAHDAPQLELLVAVGLLHTDDLVQQHSKRVDVC